MPSDTGLLLRLIVVAVAVLHVAVAIGNGTPLVLVSDGAVSDHQNQYLRSSSRQVSNILRGARIKSH